MEGRKGYPWRGLVGGRCGQQIRWVSHGASRAADSPPPLRVCNMCMRLHASHAPAPKLPRSPAAPLAANDVCEG